MRDHPCHIHHTIPSVEHVSGIKNKLMNDCYKIKHHVFFKNWIEQIFFAINSINFIFIQFSFSFWFKLFHSLLCRAQEHGLSSQRVLSICLHTTNMRWSTLPHCFEPQFSLFTTDTHKNSLIKWEYLKSPQPKAWHIERTPHMISLFLSSLGVYMSTYIHPHGETKCILSGVYI